MNLYKVRFGGVNEVVEAESTRDALDAFTEAMLREGYPIQDINVSLVEFITTRPVICTRRKAE